MRFLTSDELSHECVVHISAFANMKITSILGRKRAKAASRTWIPLEKVTIWCAMPTKCVVGPYYFNNEKVSGFDHYRMLDIHVRSGAQPFSQRAVLQQEGVPLQIKVSLVIFCMKCFEIYALEDTAQKIDDQDPWLTPTGISHGDLWTMECIRPLCVTYRHWDDKKLQHWDQSVRKFLTAFGQVLKINCILLFENEVAIYGRSVRFN